MSSTQIIIEAWKIAEDFHESTPKLFLRRRLITGEWPNTGIPEQTPLAFLALEQVW